MEIWWKYATRELVEHYLDRETLSLFVDVGTSVVRAVIKVQKSRAAHWPNYAFFAVGTFNSSLLLIRVFFHVWI